MKYVFLVSHGELARGMHTALKMLSGEDRDDILSVGLEDGMGADVFVENVKKTLSVVGEDDEILLFADLVGGSPLTNAANTIAELGMMDRTVMIGGMNMPLALSAVLMKDTMTTPDLIEMLIPEAREELKQFEITSEESDDDI